MNTEFAVWLHLTGLIALDVAIVACLAAAVARWLRAPWSRRWLWQTALVLTGILGVGEVVGLRGALRPAQTATATATARSVVVQRGEDATGARRQRTEASPAGLADESDAVRSAKADWMESGAVIAIPWMAGTLALLAWQVSARVRLAARRRRAQPVDAATAEHIGQLAERLGSSDPVTAAIWPGVSGPFALGMWRPHLALPADFATAFAPAQREAMLMHELAHVAAKDPRTLLTAQCMTALLWWHPLVWWMQRKLRLEMESAADAACRLLPGGAVALAESILTLARRFVTPMPMPAPVRALGVLGNDAGRPLAQRVRRLLVASDDGCGVWGPRPRFARRVGAFLVAATLFGLGGATSQHASLGLVPRLFAAEEPKRPAAEPRSTSAPASAAVETGGGEKGEVSSVTPEPPAGSRVLLEIKFLELRDRDAGDVGLDWLFGQASTNDAPESVEVPTGDLPGAGLPDAENIRVCTRRLKGQVIVLNDAQSGMLLHALAQRGGAEVVAAPRILTASGLAAQMSMQDAVTAVTGVRVRPPEDPKGSGVLYQTERLLFGAVVDVLPVRTNDGWAIEVRGRVSEFLGYEDPERRRLDGTPPATTNRVLAVDPRGGAPVRGQVPWPLIRVRETVASGAARAGESLLLRGPRAERRVTEGGTWWRRPRTRTEFRRLYVLVTPTSQG